MLVKILIDDEFKNLIPPLTDEEYKGLEDSIVKEGCRDALILWGNTLIDGHNRYEICTKHNIPFKTIQKDFKSRDEVILYMIDTQFARRNLSSGNKILLAQAKKPILEKLAKQRISETTAKSNTERANKENLSFIQMDKAENKTHDEPTLKNIHVQNEVAKIAGVSSGTVARFEQVQKKKPELVKAICDREISINEAYQITKLEPQEQKEIAHRIEHIAEEPKETSTPKAIVQEVLKRPHVANNSGNNEWYTPAEFIEAAVDVMGCIDLDPASNPIANKVVKADKYYTAEDNGLDKTWSGNVWLNPPYASDLIGKFADKLISERENYKQAIVLVNNATETEWFNKIVSIASAVCFPKSRVKFYMPDGKTGAPLQGQAVLYIGEKPKEFTDVFCKLGWCCNVIH